MKILEEPSITVSISTISSNLEVFVANFPFNQLSDADEVLIIIQGHDEKIYFPELKNFKLIYDSNYGLSSSRNIGIENANSDFIWFLDDDIILIENGVKKIKNHIKANNNFDLHTVRIKHSNNFPYKNYTNKKKLGRFDALKVSSVEIIVSRDFILNNNLRFNKNLGLGSNFPSNEENIFYLDIFDKGGLISHFPEYLLEHEYIDRKSIHFNNASILKAKGIFCSRYGGILGFFILVYYLVKCLYISKNLKMALNLIVGYINSKNIIGFKNGQ